MGVDFEPGLVYGIAETDKSKVIDNEFLESYGLILAPQCLRNGYGLDFVYNVEVPIEAMKNSDGGSTSGVVSPELKEMTDKFLQMLKRKEIAKRKSRTAVRAQEASMDVEFFPGVMYGVMETDSSRVLSCAFLKRHGGVTRHPKAIRQGYGLNFVYGVELSTDNVESSHIVSSEQKAQVDAFLTALKENAIDLGEPKLHYVIGGDYACALPEYLGDEDKN